MRAAPSPAIFNGLVTIRARLDALMQMHAAGVSPVTTCYKAQTGSIDLPSLSGVPWLRMNRLSNRSTSPSSRRSTFCLRTTQSCLATRPPPRSSIPSGWTASPPGSPSHAGGNASGCRGPPPPDGRACDGAALAADPARVRYGPSNSPTSASPTIWRRCAARRYFPNCSRTRARARRFGASSARSTCSA